MTPKIQILQGDITEITADAIVNAANSSLLGGGGVDGAIHRYAGPKLYEECLSLRNSNYKDGLPTGQAVATKAYELDAKYIIHTVGPIYEQDDISLLADCYNNSLLIAENLKCKSIAFPSISTGVFRVPIEVSAQTARKVISEYEFKSIEKIMLVLFNPWYQKTYKQIFEDIS